jgi:hypothetical protein
MPVVSRSTSQGGRANGSSETDTNFEIGSQSGQKISNIGGDQTINYGERTRAARTGNVLATLGLLLCLIGLALLVPVGVTTTQRVLDAVHNGGVDAPYTQYLASSWSAAVGLLVGGFVVKRFALVLVGR